jgi:Na+/melibiose symporter-like transporter
MIALWTAFYIAHLLGTQHTDWYAFPYLVTTVVACLAEIVLYVFIASRVEERQRRKQTISEWKR